MVAIFHKDSLPDIIRESILKKQSLGNEFITEQLLCEEFKLSRTSIREALKDLESIGLIERKRKKGITIRKLSLKEIIEIYDTRELIEGYAAREATKKATGTDINELREIIRRHNDSAKGDATTRIQTDSAFHSKIIDMCGNGMMRKMTDNLHILDMVFKMDCSLRPHPPHSPLPFTHEDIVDAIEGNEPNKAELFMRNHIDAAKRIIIEDVTEAKIFRDGENGTI